MSLLQSNSKVTTSTGFYDYPIEQSLRFDGSSYLSRDYTSTNGTTQFSNIIYSAWAKMGDPTASNRMYIFATDRVTNGTAEGTINNSTDRGGNGYVLGWDTDATVYVYSYGGYSHFDTTGLYRDTSAWYHIVLHIENNSFKIYINNSLVVNGSADSSRDTFNFRDSAIGAYKAGNYYSGSTTYYSYFIGYLADINCIQNSTNAVPSLPSGASNWAEAFAETKNGVWIPKEYTGSYGTNGFRLTFENGIETIGGVANQIRDESSNSNHWTKN